MAAPGPPLSQRSGSRIVVAPLHNTQLAKDQALEKALRALQQDYAHYVKPVFRKKKFAQTRTQIRKVKAQAMLRRVKRHAAVQATRKKAASDRARQAEVRD
ncbi:MAG: hypothetical protein ACHQ0J_15370 [Candidatus Dormibacterales bacterium]